MISAERTAILPLRVTSAIAFADRDPMMPANGLPLPRVGLLEPWYYQRRFRLKLAMAHVIVRQREIEWILPRNERDRNVVTPVGLLGSIEPAIVRLPIQIP